jgi:hypothetical protein
MQKNLFSEYKTNVLTLKILCDPLAMRSVKKANGLLACL